MSYKEFKLSSIVITSTNKLTVIMPFLNEGDEVENTLNSIRDTVGDNVDIIIINDGSTDNFNYTLVAEKYNVKYIENRKRIGVAASRDKGVLQIDTEYFLLLDAHMRFYQTDWVDLIVKELSENDRVLLCCNTKFLTKNTLGEIEEAVEVPAFGSTIDLDGYRSMLVSGWSLIENDPSTNIEDIACVLGAGYAASKRYWLYLRGLEGLINYGSDEAYISIKVWLEGGRCRLIKNIKIGHIYRKQAPYLIETTDSIFNKLLIAELLLPFPLKIRTYGVLRESNPDEFKKAFAILLNKRKKIDCLKKYYDEIFNVDFDKIIALNNRKKSIKDDIEEKQHKLFKQILLRSSSLSSAGLWYGTVGCILFLAQYDHLKNNDLYEELIVELIDGIYTNINNTQNINLGDGLCGIALGLAWLVHHNLMEGDINDILENVDNRIMERNPIRITDYSLETGLAGILYYVLYRLQVAQELNLNIPFDKAYLKDLYKASLRVINNLNNLESYEMASWFIAYMQKNSIKLEIPNLIKMINSFQISESSINSYNLGLKNGLSGLALSRFTENYE